MTDFSITVERGHATLRFAGELDSFSRRLAQAAADEALGHHLPRLTLDCSDLRFLDHNGLALLEQIGMRCAGSGVACRVRLPRDARDMLAKQGWLDRLEGTMSVQVVTHGDGISLRRLPDDSTATSV